MPRVRLVYRQEGPARYVSHLDVMRAFERAARRAGLPLAYTAGFNPRPKLGFAAPLAVGMTGCRECVDLELEEDVAPVEVLDRLRGTLPEGLVAVRAESITGGPALMSLVSRARYTAVGEAPEGLTAEDVQALLIAFLARGTIRTERKSVKGLKQKDIRPGIYSLTVDLVGPKLVLVMELKAGSAGNVRPDDVLSALGEVLPLVVDGFAVSRTALLSRAGQLLWDVKGEGEC